MENFSRTKNINENLQFANRISKIQPNEVKFILKITLAEIFNKFFKRSL